MFLRRVLQESVLRWVTENYRVVQFFTAVRIDRPGVVGRSLAAMPRHCLSIMATSVAYVLRERSVMQVLMPVCMHMHFSLWLFVFHVP
jgi:hypothetical protein